MVVLVLLGGATYYLATSAPRSEDLVACTMEAKLCPDGSAVGRSGPHCEFAACPDATTTPSGGQGIAPYNSGIEGVVMAGPTCPVERTPPDPQCADKPIQTKVTIVRGNNATSVVAVLTSDAQGKFTISLPPGAYTVESGPYGVPYPRCADVQVTVSATGYTKVAISCDTGIR